MFRFLLKNEMHSAYLLLFPFAVELAVRISPRYIYLLLNRNWLWHLLQLILHNLLCDHVLYPHAYQCPDIYVTLSTCRWVRFGFYADTISDITHSLDCLGWPLLAKILVRNFLSHVTMDYRG